MEGRPRVFSAGCFWLRSLLPGPSAARLRPHSSLGGLTTLARGTRAYSAWAASLVRVEHAAAPGATRGPGLSGFGREQFYGEATVFEAPIRILKTFRTTVSGICGKIQSYFVVKG
ncbi:hypothetical protein NDU88_000924 [Pleurodeles waltl]|uniref:Uncharacterized protein n=1 Tax=Pleurodeles waltl TaxID=8319 RepID=A0AAV7URY8_PLEWA|nr:hypothetical protein NDU88_000924 [Pleurodeles waltl]